MLVLGAIAAGAVTGCRVMSWNVHGVCGIYGNCDADQAPRTKRQWAAVIAQQGFPGVVGLQEICDGPGRQDISELVDRLAAAGQRYYYYFKTTHEGSDKFHHCGNAILSVLPLRDRSCIWLSFDPVRTCSTGPQPPPDCVPEDCRVAMSAIVDVPTGDRTIPVRVFNTHTAGAPYAFDSARQTQAVVRWVTNFGDTDVKVVTGDFQNGNAFHPVFQGFRDRGFSTAVNSDGRTPYTHSQDTETCPPPPGEVGNKPDYIWTNLALTDWFAPCVRSGTSDHFPLVAEFDFTVVGGPAPGGGSTVDEVPPRLTLRGAKRQRFRRALVVRARCDEPCRLAVSGKLSVQGMHKKAKVGSWRQTRPAPAGRWTRVKVKLSRRTRTAARRGVARSRRVKVTLRVTATDAAGNLSARKFKIALKK